MFEIARSRDWMENTSCGNRGRKGYLSCDIVGDVKTASKDGDKE